MRGHVPGDPVEVDVAAHHLDLRAADDLTGQAEIAGDRVEPERAEVAVELCVRRRGLDRDAGAVRHRGPHTEVAAEDERERGEREAELALAAASADKVVAVVADFSLFEEALAAVDGDVRLLALGRLDLDVSAGNADLCTDR